jgi:membrane-associated phospholipid phosphatase
MISRYVLPQTSLEKSASIAEAGALGIYSSGTTVSIKKLLWQTLQENKWFMIGYYLVLLAGIYPLWRWNKVEVFLYINQYHHPLLDACLYYWTHWGSGITYLLLLCLLYLCGLPCRKFFVGLMSFGTMSVIVQTLKRVIFTEQHRPFKILSDAGKVASLHLVDKVEVLSDLSFPSGHAATIFTAACVLQLISTRKNLWYSISLLVIAISTAYSRVYLCQHFYTDIYAGAWIGGTTAWIGYVVLRKYESSPHGRWLSSLYPKIDALKQNIKLCTA